MKEVFTTDVVEQSPIANGVNSRRMDGAMFSLIEVLAEHWRWLMYTALCAVVFFSIIAFLLPKRYEASGRLMPPDQGNSSTAMMSALMGNSGNALGLLASDALGLRSSGATIIGVLMSRTVADELINKFDLRKLYRTNRYESARKILWGQTDISEDRKSGIITIAVQDRDPQRAAQLCQAYIDDLNQRIASLSTSAARREREFLEARLQTIKQQLDDSTYKLSSFSSRNITFDPQIQGKAMMDAAAALQGQLIAAETELSGLEQIYGRDNARVRSAQARVGELRSKLRNLAGAGGAQSQNNIGPSLEQLPLLGNTYAELARQAKINEAVYEVLTKQYELAKVQEAKEIPTIRVLDYPVVPEHKIWPPRLFLILAGTATILIFAIAVIFLKLQFRRLEPDDWRRILLLRIRRSMYLPKRQKEIPTTDVSASVRIR